MKCRTQKRINASTHLKSFMRSVEHAVGGTQHASTLKLEIKQREKRKMKEITVGSVVVHMNKGYPAYKAKDVHMTGLPIYTSIDRRAGGAAEHLQSTTQRKKAGFPVQENERPLGWYRVMNGYVPLYKEGKHK